MSAFLRDLLMPDRPLLVSPKLAEAVGLNESIVLQQLHYWAAQSRNEHDGHRWVYNTAEEWQRQFPFWSVKTIRRIFEKLSRELKLIEVIPNPHDKMDRTRWYRPRYEAALRGLESPYGQVDHFDVDNLASSNGSDSPVAGGQPGQLSNRTETTTETSTESDALFEDGSNVVTIRQVKPTDLISPKVVDRKRVSLSEFTLADKVLTEWNRQTGQKKAADGYRAKIIMRLREHPEVSFEEHAAIIARNLAAPWWKGEPDPSVVYGKDEQFERAMACDGKPRDKQAANARMRGVLDRVARGELG